MKKFFGLIGLIVILMMVATSALAGIPDYAYKDGHYIPTLIEIDKSIAGQAFDQLRLEAQSVKDCPECIVIIQGVGENPDMKAEMVKLWLLNNEKVAQSQIRVLKTTGMQPIKTNNNGVLLTIATKQDLSNEKFPENIYVKTGTGYKPLYIKGDCQLLGKLNDTYYLIKLLCPGFTCATPECLEVVPIAPTKSDCPTCENKGQSTFVGKSDKEILKDSLMYWGPIGAGVGLTSSLYYVEGACKNDGSCGGDVGMCVIKDDEEGIEYDWACIAATTIGGYAVGVGLGYLGEKIYYEQKNKRSVAKKEQKVLIQPAGLGVKLRF